jgi:hypothetical protein
MLSRFPKVNQPISENGKLSSKRTKIDAEKKEDALGIAVIKNNAQCARD